MNVTNDSLGASPAMIEIIKNSLTAITDEMGMALKKSSYSPNIKTREDYTCSLFNNRLEMLAQTAHQIGHLGAFPFIVKETMKRKRPSFSESVNGYRSFSALLEDAQSRGYIQLRKDERSGSYIVVELGHQVSDAVAAAPKKAEPKPRRRQSRSKSAAPVGDPAAPPKPKSKRATAPKKKTGPKRSTVGGMRRPQRTSAVAKETESGAEGSSEAVS